MQQDNSFAATLSESWGIISSGGWVMIPLFLLGMVAFYVGARLLLFFMRGNHKKTSVTTCEEWIRDTSKAKGMVGEIIRYAQDGVESVSEIQDRFAEIRTAEIPRLQQNITFLQIMINTAPLLGLLGTVLGMLTTQQILVLWPAVLPSVSPPHVQPWPVLLRRARSDG